MYMKILVFPLSLVLLAAAPIASSDTAGERPCFSVTVQNDPVNHSSVQQDCDRNFNRTVQAGKENSVRTLQTGQMNDSKVRQYHYDPSKYLDRIRGH